MSVWFRRTSVARCPGAARGSASPYLRYPLVMAASLPIVLLALATATAAGVAILACASGGGGGDDVYGGGTDDGGGGGDGAGGGPDARTTGDGGHPVEAGCPTACPCGPMGPPSSCTAAMSLGTLTPGQMASASGNIVPATSQAYVSVTFTGNTSPGYHPQIALTTGAMEFAFDVTSDCAGTLLGCDDQTDGGAGLSTWEEYYGDGGDFSNPDAFVPIAPSGNDGGVIVRVYRRTGQAATCNQYTLTVSE
jgi:hypothetical protein